MKLFGTAGIRMKYPSELDPLLLVRIGNVVGRLRLSNKAFIVHDSRVTSPILTYSIAIGLMSSGVDTSIIGLAPTPIAGYVSMREKAIGVSITASHNPPEYNGVKLYDPEGFEFTRDLEERMERAVDLQLEYVNWNSVGELNQVPWITDEYVEDLLSFIGSVKAKWNPRILVDCANGASYMVTPSVVRRLGGIPITYSCNPDGFFPVRSPEPRKDILESMLHIYSGVEPAVILAHDGDADRVAVLDPRTGFIRQDRVLAYYAKKILEERKGHVIVSIDTGFVVDEVVYDMNGSIERYVLGKTHERVKELGLSKVVMAGEPWKLVYTRWGPWVDGIMQVALITKAIIENGKSFPKILDEEKIPEYPWDRRSYLIEPYNIRDSVYATLVEELKGLLGDPVKIINIDGYRFEYKDYSWILVRKSGTEPKIRVYMEARSRERINEMIDKVEIVICKVVKEHNGRIAEKTIG